MTNNDAAKAFNGCRTNTVLNGNMVVYHIPLQQEEKIRTALTKSAKVDGLLTALLIAKRENWISNKEAREAAIASIDTAIQRFNGEV